MKIIGDCIVYHEITKHKVIVVAGSFETLFSQIGDVEKLAKELAAQHHAKSIEYWAGGNLITESLSCGPQ